MVCGIQTEMKKLNWDYIHYSIKEKMGYSLSEYSMKKLGRSQSYLSQCKNGRVPLNENCLTFMIKDMGLDENILWQINETDAKEPEENEMTAEEFNNEFSLLTDTNTKPEAVITPEHSEDNSLLEEINTKLDMVLELETKINKIEENLNKLLNTPKESALDRFIKALAEV